MNKAVRGLERARDWLDERGRVAWIAAMVIGFVLFWPIGLALLVYMIWSKRMGCNWSRHHHRHRGRPAPATPPSTATARRRCGGSRRSATPSSRFLDQLRAAKDKAEFDQFMSSRQAPQPA